MIQSVALVYKQYNESALSAAKTVEQWLTSRGVSVLAIEHKQDSIDAESLNVSPQIDLHALSHVDIIIVLGGDGTIVSVVRQLLGITVPIVGINFGKVGFLAELSADSWEQGLENILANKIRVEKRMSLCLKLERNKEIIYQGEVVNDAVVTRGKVARLGLLNLVFDDQHFASLRSDGLIVSTPTGSTGYACSAGGSLLHPSIAAYIVAAICPFLSHFPPLVQSSSTQLSITIGDSDPDIFLTLDGQLSLSLQTGDSLSIHGYPDRFCFAELGIATYFERLLRSGFVVGSIAQTK